MRRRMLAVLTAALAVGGSTATLAAVPAPASATSAAAPSVTLIEPVWDGSNGWAVAPFSVILRVQLGRSVDEADSSWWVRNGDVEEVGTPTSGDNILPVTHEGVSTVSWLVSDHDQNVYADQRQVKLDLTDPVITLQTPDDLVLVQGEAQAIGYHCEDSVSGLASCQSGAGPSGSLLDTSTPGHFTVQVTGTDEAGRVGRRSLDYTVLAPDTTAPTVRLDTRDQEMSGGWIVKPAGFADVVAVDPVVPDAQHSGLDSVSTSIDGGPEQSGRERRAEFSGEGFHTVVARATDKAGNTSAPVTVRYGIDSLAPTVAVTYPAPGQVLTPSSSDAVRWSCSDATSGVAVCATGVYSSSGSGTASTGRLDLSPGPHELRIDAGDHAGHRTQLVVPYRVVAPSTTRLAVSAPSRGRSAATVRVVSSVVAGGKVAIYDGRRRLALTRLPNVASVTTARVATVRVVLPRLTRGLHVLRAVYLGSATVRRSTSRDVVVRIR